MAAANPCISIGHVLYLRCTLCDPPKQKFFVVAHVDPLRMFLINSDLTGFARASAKIVAASPMILLQEHLDFLDHDSYVSCDWISHEYSYEQVERKLAEDASLLVGRLSPAAKAAVHAALQNNHLIAKKHRDVLLPLWGAEIACHGR